MMKKLYFILLFTAIVTVSNAQSVTGAINTDFDMSGAWPYPTYGTVAQGDILNFSGTFGIVTGNPVTQLEIKLILFASGFSEVQTWLATHSTDLTSGTYDVDFEMPGDALNTADLQTGEFYLFQVRPTHEGGESTFTNAYVTIDGTHIPLSIGDLEAADAVMYPNPVKEGGVLNIDASGFENDVTVDVYSMTGAKVYSAIDGAGVISINSGELAKGMYTVVISDDSKVATKKIIIK